MTLKEFGDLVIYLGAVSAALGSISFVLYRWAWRPFVRTLKAELGAARQVTEAVHAEMQPNHGTSMRDLTNRIEQKVDRTEQKVDDLRACLREHLDNHPGG